jgi:rhamnosyltransferase
MNRASVIVRAKDEAATIELTLRSLRAQTVRPQIIVIDSGSTDGTTQIARGLCDRLIEIPPSEFTYGGTLNLGAREASAPVVFALSAHCHAERTDWIERSLSHYDRSDVAATNGVRWMPDGNPLRGPFFQDVAHAREHPFWGFSNHASSWRRSLWEDCSFSETIATAEDKEWAMRVLAAGWTIAFDPELFVSFAHGWRTPAEFYRRNVGYARAIRSFADVPRFGWRELAREWWDEMPDSRHSRSFHRFANYVRMAGLAGKFMGHRLPPR